VLHGNIIDRGSPGKRSHAKIPQSKRQMIISIFIVCAIVASSVQLLMLQSQRNAERSPLPARISMTPHDPIIIVGNPDFLITDAVRSGNGDPGDPYIISDWAINATDGIGIYIIGTDADFVIRNVTINSSAQNNDAIRLEGVTNGQIRNVTISNCFEGIAITNGCSNIIVSDSTIIDNADCGIITQFGTTSYVDIKSNKISANGGTGIALDTTSHFNIMSNNVTTNDPSSGGRRPVTLVKCSIGVVTGNDLDAVFNPAMYSNTCQNVVVANNSFSSVWNFCIEMRVCSGFLIYHNNFLGVPPQAFDNWGPENMWNSSYPAGGNYWIDYTGVDEKSGPIQNLPGSDGIGDLPYVIDVNTTDYYPLNKTGKIEPIPEFPTLLLPIISVLALLFAAVRRTSRKDL